MFSQVAFALRVGAVACYATLALSACSDDDPERPPPAGSEAETPLQGADPDPDFDLFPRTDLLEVDIQLPEADWEQLKSEGRSINEVFSGCTTEHFGYTLFEAEVRVGEHTFKRAAVRKKGYIGSLSSFRPSLRVQLDAYLPDQALGGSKVITLNNSFSDPSYAAQCMSYAVFEAAGVPAPRCGFARVRVNGESLGVYVSVEPIRKPFLRRHFADDNGDLYEGGGGSDFREDMLGAFEKKTNEAEPQGPELKALADVLLLPDAELISALEKVIDLEQFLRFWAAETLVGHWDGYTGDLNNFFLYVDPADGKLRFIPWGTDNAFESQHPFLPQIDWPRSAYAWARLPRRLYALAQTRERYRQILREMLDAHWDEEALLRDVDQIAALAHDSVQTPAVDTLREFIRKRRAELRAELDAPAKPWIIPERATAQCRTNANSPLRITFYASWGDLAASVPNPDNSVTATVEGKPLTPLYVASSAGESTDPAAPGKALRISVGNPDGSFTSFQFMLLAPELKKGELALHGFETYGVVVTGKLSGGVPVGVRRVAFIGEGRIVFDEVGTTPGAVLKGHIEAQIVSTAANPQTM